MYLITDVTSAEFPIATANTLRELALMYNPDYIIMSEVQGEEALRTVSAALSGHPTMSTIHVENEEDFQKQIKAYL
jgi:type IV secretory pathway ATPase VirB11/archaellum biosynthesis ATPase